MRRQVAALAAEGKLSAMVLGGLPPAFLLYLLLANRDYVMVLFTTADGLRDARLGVRSSSPWASSGCPASSRSRCEMTLFLILGGALVVLAIVLVSAAAGTTASGQSVAASTAPSRWCRR